MTAVWMEIVLLNGMASMTLIIVTIVVVLSEPA